jgi:hypothetical protein
VFNMEQSVQVPEHSLLQISMDLHNRMAEIQALGQMVRSAEAAQRRRDQEPIHPAVVAPRAGNEVRV